MEDAPGAASESLGGAVGGAPEVFDAATAAFAHGLNVAAATAAVLLAATRPSPPRGPALEPAPA